MSKPTIKLPAEVSEYNEAMKVWRIAGAEWLGLDPKLAFDFNVKQGKYEVTEVSWQAVSQLTPRVGQVHAPGMTGFGETVTFYGSVSLVGQDSADFWKAVGPKPRAPWESPEALEAFEFLRRMT